MKKNTIKILIGVGSAVVLGAVVYFGFIRKAKAKPKKSTENTTQKFSPLTSTENTIPKKFSPAPLTEI